MSDEQPLTVDDLVPRLISEHLGSRIPTRAVLIVETMTEQGNGIRFFTADAMTWQALGMIRSVQLRLEQEDAADWGGLG